MAPAIGRKMGGGRRVKEEDVELEGEMESENKWGQAGLRETKALV